MPLTSAICFFKSDFSKSDFSKNNSPQKLEQGTSLLEVLVALIILSIGVLGHVGLQLSAVNASQINNHLIKASQISNNLANRITLNKKAVFEIDELKIASDYIDMQSYDLSRYGACQGSYYHCFCKQPPTQINTCRQIDQSSLPSCNSAQLMQFDIYEISCQLVLLANSARVKIYSFKINSTIALLSINVIWPEQQLLVNRNSNNELDIISAGLSNSNANSSFRSISMQAGTCQQAVAEFENESGRLMCYSQSLVISAD